MTILYNYGEQLGTDEYIQIQLPPWGGRQRARLADSSIPQTDDDDEHRAGKT